MSLADRFRVWLARGLVKAAGVPMFPAWLQATFTVPTFQALTREGYAANGAVFACVSALAFAFPEPKLCVYREADSGLVPVPNHPLLRLLARPNPVMGLAELLQFTTVYEAIGGNCYWYKVRSPAGRVVWLWPLNDSQMTVVPSPTELVDHYELQQEVEEPKPIAREDVVHFKWLPDAERPWMGMAPLKPVAREVDTDNEATRYLFALLKNDAIPRLLLLAGEDSEPLSEEEKTRFNTEWQERYGGMNRGRPAILNGIRDVRTLSLNLQELAFEALRRVPEARICAAFRTPPIIAGLNVGLERSTFANYGEARRQWTENTLVPLWVATANEIAADLLPEFGDPTGLTVGFDLGTVVALARPSARDGRGWITP